VPVMGAQCKDGKRDFNHAGRTSILYCRPISLHTSATSSHVGAAQQCASATLRPSFGFFVESM
jgi:hypothetical protein